MRSVLQLGKGILQAITINRTYPVVMIAPGMLRQTTLRAATTDSQYGFSAAPFFINAMMGEPYGTTSLAAEGQWANIIESSAISLNIGSYTGCQNSASVSKALDPNKQNDFVFTDACVSGASDILIQNASGSVTYAQIKISCGNFVVSQ
jgi:hypothetical protein